MNKDSSSEGIDTSRVEMRARAGRNKAEYQPALDDYACKLIARIQRNHRDTEAVLALQAHYELHADFPSLANLMEGWGRTLRDDRGAADAFVAAAEAALSGMQDQVRAQQLFREALDRFPEHLAALARLEASLMELGQYTDLERSLTALTRALERRKAEPKLRADVHYRLGQLYEWRLLLLGSAITHYKTALELDPTLVPAIAAARGIYLRSGKAQAAADMYELQIAVTRETWQHHGLLLALAKHRHEQLRDLDGAVLALRRALKATPGENAAIELLATLLSERGLRKENPNALADSVRAAELYYQLASETERAEAPKFLERCLRLQPNHARALQLRSEIEAHTAPGLARSDVDDELAAWLDDAEVTLVDEGVTTQNMVPLSERPPPPDAPARRRKRFQV